MDKNLTCKYLTTIFTLWVDTTREWRGQKGFVLNNDDTTFVLEGLLVLPEKITLCHEEWFSSCRGLNRALVCSSELQQLRILRNWNHVLLLTCRRLNYGESHLNFSGRKGLRCTKTRLESVFQCLQKKSCSWKGRVTFCNEHCFVGCAEYKQARQGGLETWDEPWTRERRRPMFARKGRVILCNKPCFAECAEYRQGHSNFSEIEGSPCTQTSQDIAKHNQIPSKYHQMEPKHHQIRPKYHQMEPEHHQIRPKYHQMELKHHKIWSKYYNVEPNIATGNENTNNMNCG